MKRVTFKVAKALKEAGYPQPQTDALGYVNRPNNCYFTGIHSYYDENRERRLEWKETDEFHTTDDWVDEIEPIFYGSAIAAPVYLEAWLWMWREKHIPIEADYSFAKENWINGGICGEGYDDPEESIIAAINYLIEKGEIN